MGIRCGSIVALSFGVWRPADAKVEARASKSSLGCLQPGLEDWPAVHRRLIKLLDGGRGDSLSEELGRAASLQDVGDVSLEEVQAGDCIPGRIALKLLLLAFGSQIDVTEAAAFLESDWRVLSVLGWPAVIRSGWPIFRLIRLLTRRILVGGAQESDHGVPSCGHEERFATLLKRHVRQRRALDPGDSLLASSVAFLTAASVDEVLCPLSLAGAFLVGAWARFPVYDSESEDAVRLAEQAVAHLPLRQLLSTDHAFLDIVDDVAGAYQTFLIDSGWLYKDTSSSKGEKPAVDYTRHMDSSTSGGPIVLHPSACPPPLGITPTGKCNPFASLGVALSPWRRSAVAPGDAARAFLHSANASADEVALLRFMDEEVLVVTLPSVDPAVADCLAKSVLSVLARTKLPPFELVVSFSDKPLLAKQAATS